MEPGCLEQFRIPSLRPEGIQARGAGPTQAEELRGMALHDHDPPANPEGAVHRPEEVGAPGRVEARQEGGPGIQDGNVELAIPYWEGGERTTLHVHQHAAAGRRRLNPGSGGVLMDVERGALPTLP